MSGIGVATPLCIAKHKIDYFHLVLRTWCMSTPTQESLIKMCHLQTKPQQNGTGKLLYPRTLILRDLRTFLSEDSDYDYDDVSDFDTPNISIDNENTQGRSKEQEGLQQQAQGIEEDRRDLQD
jgi:hypothetical protein